MIRVLSGIVLSWGAACRIPVSPVEVPPKERVGVRPVVEVERAVETCDLSSAALSSLSALFDEIQAIGEGEEWGQWDTAASNLQAVLAGPGGAELVAESGLSAPESGRALKDWWQRGGSAWMRWRISGQNSLFVFAPTMREEVELADVSAAIRCGEQGCPRARAFLQAVEDTDLRLASFERGLLFATAPEPVDKAGGRPTMRQRACSDAGFREWVECVGLARSSRFVFPLGDFRLPREGWFVVTPHGMYGSGCINATAVDLATGNARWTSGCRVYSGRADREAFRELALLALLAGRTEVVSDFLRISVPEPIQAENTCRSSHRKANHHPGRGGHSMVSFWLLDGEDVVAGGHVTAGERGDPIGRVLRARHRDASARLQPGPVSSSLPVPSGHADSGVGEVLHALSAPTAR
jgi:hypothetical protein